MLKNGMYRNRNPLQLGSLRTPCQAEAEGAIRFNVVGLREKEVRSAESFIEALRIFHECCIEPVSQGKKLQDLETACYIEAKGEIATARMHYPYVFEFAIKAGLIKNGKLAEPLIEPSITELIAAFSRASVLQMVGTIGCH